MTNKKSDMQVLYSVYGRKGRSEEELPLSDFEKYFQKYKEEDAKSHSDVLESLNNLTSL